MSVYKYTFDKNTSEKTLVVVDVSAVMRTNYVPLDQTGVKFPKRTLSHPVNGKDFNTSALYGLLRLFSRYGLGVDYIFCFDSYINDLKTYDGTYKAGRVIPTNEYFDQLNVLRDTMIACRFNVALVEGFEADHMVHVAIQQTHQDYDRILVITNDIDLASTVNDKVIWVNTLQKKSDICIDNYEEIAKCPYNTILLKKALVGDVSDNIKGVAGFGAKSFNKFLEIECIDTMAVAGNEKAIIVNAVTLNEDKKRQALHSLHLVYPKFPRKYWITRHTDVDAPKWLNFLATYGMNSLLKLWQD